jgi:hypothetical protein
VAALLSLAYALSLLPVITLEMSWTSSMNERLVYLPSAWVLLLACALFYWRLQRPWPRGWALTAVLGVYLASLEHGLTAWRGAGRLVSSLIPEIAAASRGGSITLVGLPDNLLGAYVFRNGLPEALALERGATEVTTLVYVQASSPDEPVRVDRVAGGLGLELTLQDLRSWVASVTPTDGLRVEGEPEGTNRVRLVGVLPPRLYGYSAGHIRPLTQFGPSAAPAAAGVPTR